MGDFIILVGGLSFVVILIAIGKISRQLDYLTLMLKIIARRMGKIDKEGNVDLVSEEGNVHWKG